MTPGPTPQPTRRRGRLAGIAAAAMLALAGGGYALWSALLRPAPTEDQLLARGEREFDPMLVPRRHRPQVVEPVAGQVAGVPAPEEIAPRSSRGGEGPSGGAPSDAQVRRELARLQAMSRRYHFDQLDFSGKLIPFDALPGDGWRQSIASVFYDYGHGLACGGVLRPDQLGVAHKTAPCGTLITFRYGGRAIRVPVIDRGPYIAGREWDFTGATAAALGFPGLGAIDWHV
jgi:Lytic transglycolase